MFNPDATVRHVAIPGHAPCLVVDNFLRDPEQLLAYADAQRDSFAHEGGNYFPGPEVAMPDAFSKLLGDYFTLHARAMLGGRRTLDATSRLSMVTKPPALLHPLQRICHRDTMVGRRRVEPGTEGIGASVLYLFKDSALGGTSFYAPAKPQYDIDALIGQAMSLPGDAFDAILQAPPAYMSASNDYFEQICTIPAVFNRAIFYDGSIFHSAQLDHPERLSQDPALGRLTLNGFFLFRKNAA